MELLTETVTEAPGAPALKIGGKVLARNTVLNFAGGAAPVLLALVTIPYVIRGPRLRGSRLHIRALIGYRRPATGITWLGGHHGDTSGTMDEIVSTA
jgi:hypothetical protein